MYIYESDKKSLDQDVHFICYRAFLHFTSELLTFVTMTLKSPISGLMIVLLWTIGQINHLSAQIPQAFGEPGDKYERIYQLSGLEVQPSSFATLGGSHVVLGLEIMDNGDQEHVNISFFDFKGTVDNSFEISFGDSLQVDILQAGDVIPLSDGTFVFSAILDQDSLNKVVTRIDSRGNVVWSEITGQFGDSKDLRSSKSVLIELPHEKIWHAHIVDAVGSSTDLQITEFAFDGTKNFVRTLNIGTDDRPISDEDLIEMKLAIDSTVMLLGTTDNTDIPVFISRLDTLANIRWTKGYNGDFGRELDREGYDMVQLLDTTWVVVGSVLPTQTQRHEGFIMHLSDEGDRLQTELITATSTQYQLYPTGVVQLLDSTITIGLTREDMVSEELNPLIFNYDLDSAIAYQTLLDTIVSTDPNISGLATSDSMSVSYISTVVDDGFRVPYLSKLDEEGTTPCFEDTDIIVIDTVDFTDVDLSPALVEETIDIDSINIGRTPFGRFSPPILSLQDTTFCADDPVFYRMDATVRGGFVYEWEDMSRDPIRIVRETGMFMVTVGVNEDICFLLCDTVTVNQTEFPMVTIEQNLSRLCTDGEVILTATESGSAAESFLWSTGETTRTIVVPADPGTSYDVMITDACDLTASANTSIGDLIPDVSGTIEFSCGAPGTLTLTGEGFFSLLWSTGDTSRVISINTPDTYSVTLFDFCGEPMDVVDDITISAEDLDNCTTCGNNCLIWPNAMQPNNGDPESQVFGPVFAASGCEDLIQDYELRIFNRWGKNIFTSTDVNVNWNGAINGSNQPGGVYYYWARYFDGSSTCERRGDLTLIR